MAYKVFSNGDALTGGELNTFLMNQSVIAFASVAARNAALTAPLEGQLVWLEDSNKYVYYTGSAWADLITPPSTSDNAIINGAFDIWQRGTTLSAGGFLADRWFFDSDASVLSQSRQTFTPGSAPVAGYEGAYYLNFTKNGSGSYGGVYQKIEDVRTFAGQSATLSFWAKANNATTMTSRVSQEFGSGGSSTVNLTDQTVSLTTSWQRFTLTYSFGALTGKTIGTSSFVTLEFVGAANNAIDIWGVQLEAGSVATAFQTATGTLQGELAACQRYYQVIQNTNSKIISNGYYNSATAIYSFASLPVEMRTVPTLSIVTGTNFYNAVSTSGNDNINSLSLAGESSSRTIFLFNNTEASGTLGAGLYILTNNASSFIGVQAEL
jgi:hypothetical protein